MNVKKLLGIRIAAACCLAAAVLPLLSACDGSGYVGSVTNRDVLNYREFSLDAASVNLTTRVDGTVFVRGDLEKPDDITVRVAMTVAIDPADWGGVSLYFPEGWCITSLDSSVVEIDPPYYSNLAGVSTNGQPEEGGQSWVSVGYPLVLAGDSLGDLVGSLVVDADFVWEDQPAPEVLELTVGVGSQDGYIVNPVSLDLAVPLLEDFRPNRVDYLFPRQHTQEDLDASEQIQGELVLENGELRVDGYLVIWPWEYYGWADTETVWLRRGDSTDNFARVGDTLVITGYEVDRLTAAGKTVSFVPVDSMEGPYWLADHVVVMP